jgi:hypothetical protein
VRTIPEADARGFLAIDPEAKRLVEYGLVSISRREAKNHPIAFTHVSPVEVEIARCNARELMDPLGPSSTMFSARSMNDRLASSWIWVFGHVVEQDVFGNSTKGFERPALVLTTIARTGNNPIAATSTAATTRVRRFCKRQAPAQLFNTGWITCNLAAISA